MTDFSVNPKGIKDAAGAEKNVGGKMRQMEQRADLILAQMSMQTPAVAALRSSLKRTTGQISDARSRLTAYANALDNAAQLYASAENRIAGYSVGTHGSNEGRNNGAASDSSRDNLRSELEKLLRNMRAILGMDSGSAYSKDPVNLSNGNFVYENTFFGFDTGIDINLRLFYNLRDKEKRCLGPGWTHNFERTLTRMDDRIEIRREDGASDCFALSENEWIPYAGTFGRLEAAREHLDAVPEFVLSAVRNAVYIFTDQEHDHYYYGEDGRLLAVHMDAVEDGIILSYAEEKLVQVVHNHGISLRFGYDLDGRLVSATDHTGRAAAFSYSGEVLTAVTAPDGTIVRYQYDENERLIRIINGRSEAAVINEYDEQDRTVRQIFPDGGIVTYDYSMDDRVAMVQQNGSVVTYVHDDQFRNTRIIYEDGTETFKYNAANKKTEFVDKLGRVSRYEYNDAGHLTAFVNALGHRMEMAYTPDDQPRDLYINGFLMNHSDYNELRQQITSTNANGGQVHYEYDAQGRVTSMIHEDGSVTRLAYDEEGNISAVDDPRSGHIQYEYDNRHRLIAVTDALGNRTAYEYDLADRLISITNAEGNRKTCEYDACGNMTSCTDYNGGITRIKYNAMNQPVQVTDPDGFSTCFTYDQMGNIVSRSTDDGAVTTFEYDSMNRLICRIQPDGSAVRAEYDACGNLVRKLQEDGSAYQLEYDALDRPVAITDPVGTRRTMEYDEFGNEHVLDHGDGQPEVFEYDLMGHCIRYQDKSGYIRYFTYSVLGDLTEVSDDRGWLRRYSYYPGGLLKSENFAEGPWKEYEYDAAGNIVKIHDQDGACWHFTYDVMGRVARAEHDGAECESYEYDAMDNIVAVTDALGQKTTYRYSLAGSLIGVTEKNGAQTMYEYDSCYRLTKIMQPVDGKIDAAKINEMNASQQDWRVTSYTRNLMGRVVSVTDPENNRTEFGYDICGRLSERKDADGFVTSCVYNPDGTERTVSFHDGRQIQYQYNPVKQLIGLQDWLGELKMQRDAAGRVTEVTDHKGAALSYGYDERGSLTKLTYPDGSKVSYEYNDRLQLTWMHTAEADVAYKYADTGRLSRKTVSGGTFTDYAFDKAGRIESLDHYLEGKHMAGYAYSYDRCGRKNRIASNIFGQQEIREFQYNAAGNLEGIFKNGQPVQQFEYDLFGNRKALRQNNRIIRYTYNRNDELTNQESADSRLTYIYDRRGNLSQVQNQGVTELLLHFDEANCLTYAESAAGNCRYEYNGMGFRTGMKGTYAGEAFSEAYMLNYLEQGLQFGEADGMGCLLSAERNGVRENVLWDQQMAGILRGDYMQTLFCDERMSPVFAADQEGVIAGNARDAFGNSLYSEKEAGGTARIIDFAGFRKDPVTGFEHARAREYDPITGRFISRDPVAGSMLLPMTLNAYLYGVSDPINHIDPTGMIFAWLAGGIVGAVASGVTRLAGDVVNSVKNGKWTPSSWQDYVGDLTGGFVEGSTFVVAGPAAAGAAGAATRTVVSNGLKMATGVEGYRKEDGYSFGNLAWDTAKSAAGGAVEGFAFGQASKFIKIPTINKGRGSFEAVWKACMTKAQRGIIANVSLKTMVKALAVYGIVKPADKFIRGLYDYEKETLTDWIKGKVLPSTGLPASLSNAFAGTGNARCPLAA